MIKLIRMLGGLSIYNFPDNDSVTDLEKEELKGPVQKFKLNTHVASKKKGVIIQGEINLYAFWHGNKIITYGKNGKKLEERIFEITEGFSIQTFNDEGKEFENKVFIKDGNPQSYSLREYDSKGEILAMTHIYYPDESYNSKSIWKNNEMGKTIEYVKYNPLDVLKEIHKFKYDDTGFQIEQKAKNADGSFLNWIKHERNSHGDLIKDTHLNEDGSIEKVVNHNREYDSDGKPISKHSSSFGSEILTEFEFEYDSHENWIKKTYFIKDKPLIIQFREINYFGDEPTITDTIEMNKTKMDLTIEVKHPDLEKNELKGPVYKVKQTCYKASKKNGEIVMGELDDDMYFQGNKIVTFNEKGEKTQDLIYDLDGSFYKQTFVNGLDIDFIKYNKNGLFQDKYIKDYYPDGKVLSMSRVSGDNVVHSKNVWVNDERGNTIEFNTYGYGDVLTEQRLHKYDKNGFQIEQKGMKTDGTFILWHKYENNEHGHSIKDTQLNEDGSILKVENRVWNYDAEGKLIGLNGHITDKDEPVNDFEYEYDAHENWIKKTTSYKGKPLCIQLREINYFGDVPTIIDSIVMEKKEETPVPEPEVKKVIPQITEESFTGELNGKQLMWLAEGSPSFEDFSALRYYVLKNNSYPSVTLFSAGNIEVMSFLQEMKNDMDAEVIHSAFDKESGYDRMTDFTVSFPNNEGYILQVSDINEEDADIYRIPYHVETNDYGNVFTGTVNLLHPNDASDERDEDFETEIENMIDLCSLEYIPQKPYIYMIQASGPQWYIKHYSVNDSFEIKDLDLNYGPGFSEFDRDLMNRFKSETKGLVLLHGIPGTGKTYYIRHLLRSMLNNNKVVIYMPPNMVDHLTEPGFMTFISQQVSSFSQQGKFCVLLIEDAEPLLQQRQSDTRIQGVTNLLNMTDGLLNDMLKIQIICTFNVNLKKIDKALLRPGRLLARKEFKPLPPLEANILATRLGIKHTFKKAATLAEIFSFTENKNTLIHGTDEVEDEEDDF